MQVVEKVRVAFGQTFSAHLKLNILVVVDLRIFYTIMNAHYQPYQQLWLINPLWGNGLTYKVETSNHSETLLASWTITPQVMCHEFCFPSAPTLVLFCFPHLLLNGSWCFPLSGSLLITGRIMVGPFRTRVVDLVTARISRGKPCDKPGMNQQPSTGQPS